MNARQARGHIFETENFQIKLDSLIYLLHPVFRLLQSHCVPSTWHESILYIVSNEISQSRVEIYAVGLEGRESPGTIYLSLTFTRKTDKNILFARLYYINYSFRLDDALL